MRSQYVVICTASRARIHAYKVNKAQGDHTWLQVVALCNTYTCRLLLNAALATGTTSFEGLAAAVGGRAFTAFAQASNIILLVGNITGDFCLLADLGSKSLTTALRDSTPQWLVAHHGRGIMVLLTVLVIFPLSLSRGLQALEQVATAGVGVILLLFAVLTADAVHNGFEGVHSGEVPLWTLQWHSGHIAEAFALIGYSFYLHPLMMPMLRELPSGKRGIELMSQSMAITIMGVALVVYTYVGAMGAAAFGADTQGDIMMNRVVGGIAGSHQRWASGAFVILMLVYLAVSIPPLVITLRSYVAFILAHGTSAIPAQRRVLLTLALTVVPLLLAWRNPGLAEKAFSLTGATGVCIVCYIIPVVAHFQLMLAKAKPAAAAAAVSVNAEASSVHVPLLTLPGSSAGASPRYDGEQQQPSSALRPQLHVHPHADNREAGNGHDVAASSEEPGAECEYQAPPTSAMGWCLHVILPVAVLLVGCILSGMALYSAITQL